MCVIVLMCVCMCVHLCDFACACVSLHVCVCAYVSLCFCVCVRDLLKSSRSYKKRNDLHATFDQQISDICLHFGLNSLHEINSDSHWLIEYRLLLRMFGRAEGGALCFKIVYSTSSGDRQFGANEINKSFQNIYTKLPPTKFLKIFLCLPNFMTTEKYKELDSFYKFAIYINN